MRDFCSGILQVEVGQWTKLARAFNVVSVLKFDPYVILKFGENISISDVHLKAGSTCQFNWGVKFPFDVTLSEDKGPQLEISIYDKNTPLPDVNLGKVSVDYGLIARAIGRANAYQKRLALSFPGGELDVELWWEERSGAEPFPLPCHRLLKNNNHTGGVLREIVDGGKLDVLRTWQIHLWGAQAIFDGETCGWNREYKAAKMIYGSTPDCMAIREAIRVQHHLFYSREEKFGNNSRKHVQGLYQLIDTLPIHDINTSKEKSIRFTYVITTDSQMNFSITSSMKGRDFLSKHALHANAADSVIYSGEFFIDRLSPEIKSTGLFRLVIDNNSGTFAPPKSKLPALKELLEFNFGTDIPIIVLDRSDPLLKELCEINDVE